MQLFGSILKVMMSVSWSQTSHHHGKHIRFFYAEKTRDHGSTLSKFLLLRIMYTVDSEQIHNLESSILCCSCLVWSIDFGYWINQCWLFVGGHVLQAVADIMTVVVNAWFVNSWSWYIRWDIHMETKTKVILLYSKAWSFASHTILPIFIVADWDKIFFISIMMMIFD